MRQPVRDGRDACPGVHERGEPLPQRGEPRVHVGGEGPLLPRGQHPLGALLLERDPTTTTPGGAALALAVRGEVLRRREEVREERVVSDDGVRDERRQGAFEAAATAVEEEFVGREVVA